MVNPNSTEPEHTAEDMFVAFHYAEVKDLSKHFLTLIAGTLVLTISFADKIVPLGEAKFYQKILLGSCWLSLIVAFILAGSVSSLTTSQENRREVR